MQQKNRRIYLWGAGIILVAGMLPVAAGNWEEKDKYHYLDEPGKIKKKNAKYQKILGILAPAKTVFEVDAALGGTFTASRGTQVIVPGYAFVDFKQRKVKQKVKLELIEVIDPLDFVAADVDLTFYPDRGGREMFQSAGMFRVNAHELSGGAVALAPNKAVRIQFPNIVAGDDFFVYRHDAEKNWKLHGHNQDSQGNGVRIGTRRYTIDALNTWWNFDKPKPEGACAKGKVVRADGSEAKNYSVYSIGISYKGTFSRWIEAGAAFKVNVHKAEKARFLVIENSGQIGISSVVQVTDKTGFDGAEEGPQNFCQDIGSIKLEQLDEAVISDKKKLSEYLGLPVTEHKVDYQKNSATGP